ncbi:hypothetical protein [Aquimarina litoralis]|uniref:hypothetical protein n=1 Tax=Aquimarina litoralis TaxID=584605 RepID=UPI001C59967A|nr:hypothetical protein [Aquimarina litoralis]MBW1294232.1 hypothetical protein [Aquimarina litoralis]
MMKKCIKVGILLIILQSLISCSATRPFKSFTNGSHGSVNSYTAKPIYNGENTSEIYASGTLDIARQEQFRQDDDDRKTVASLDVYKSFSRKWLNFFYGANAAYGTFTFKDEELDLNSGQAIITLDEKLDFYNVGLKAGVNFKVSTSKFEFRPVGLKVMYTYEFGPYQDKLDEIDNIMLQDYNVLNKKSFFTILEESEVLYKINTNNSVGLGVFAGLNTIRDTGASIIGGMASYRYKRVIFSYLFQSTFIDTEEVEGQDRSIGINSHKIGIAFQLF